MDPQKTPGGYELFERRRRPDPPVPPGPAVAVLRQKWTGPTGLLCGELVLSAAAWQLLSGIAQYQPQVVKRPRAVELLHDAARGRIAIRPVSGRPGPHAFPLGPAHATDPVLREVWPMKIVCPEFLDYWAIPGGALDRPIPAAAETGMLAFTPGQVFA